MSDKTEKIVIDADSELADFLKDAIESYQYRRWTDNIWYNESNKMLKVWEKEREQTIKNFNTVKKNIKEYILASKETDINFVNLDKNFKENYIRYAKGSRTDSEFAYHKLVCQTICKHMKNRIKLFLKHYLHTLRLVDMRELAIEYNFIKQLKEFIIENLDEISSMMMKKRKDIDAYFKFLDDSNILTFNILYRIVEEYPDVLKKKVAILDSTFYRLGIKDDIRKLKKITELMYKPEELPGRFLDSYFYENLNVREGFDKLCKIMFNGNYNLTLKYLMRSSETNLEYFPVNIFTKDELVSILKDYKAMFVKEINGRFVSKILENLEAQLTLREIFTILGIEFNKSSILIKENMLKCADDVVFITEERIKSLMDIYPIKKFMDDGLLKLKIDIEIDEETVDLLFEMEKI